MRTHYSRGQSPEETHDGVAPSAAVPDALGVQQLSVQDEYSAPALKELGTVLQLTRGGTLATTERFAGSR